MVRPYPQEAAFLQDNPSPPILLALLHGIYWALEGIKQMLNSGPISPQPFLSHLFPSDRPAVSPYINCPLLQPGAPLMKAKSSPLLLAKTESLANCGNFTIEGLVTLERWVSGSDSLLKGWPGIKPKEQGAGKGSKRRGRRSIRRALATWSIFGQDGSQRQSEVAKLQMRN